MSLPNPNRVGTAGKPPPVRDMLATRRTPTKPCWDGCRWPVRVAQRLWRHVRPWIEPAQSLEKNPLGLGPMFFNSLRRTGQRSWWADGVVLLRSMAWLDRPKETHRLAGLPSRQMEWGLAVEKA